MFREQLWRVVMTVPRLLEQVLLRQNSNENVNDDKNQEIGVGTRWKDQNVTKL